MSRTPWVKHRDLEIGHGALGVMIARAVLWQNCGLHECPNVLFSEDQTSGLLPTELQPTDTVPR